MAVDDCGPQINPMIVEGQVHGGVVQGAGQALWEGVVYDDNGQLLTGSMQDYALPKAHMVPDIETLSSETPSPHNPLGVKGIGENRDHRLDRHHLQRGDRRAQAFGGNPPGYAADPGAGLAGDSGRESIAGNSSLASAGVRESKE